MNPFEDQPVHPTDDLASRAKSEGVFHIRDEPANYRDYDQFSYVGSSILGIMLAGAMYPIAIIIVTGLFAMGSAPSSSDMVAVVIFSVIGFLLGGMLSSITGTIAVFLIYLINKSLADPLSRETAALSAGSLAGYIPTAWVLFVTGSASWIEITTAGFFGPILAMLMGAYGASRSAKAFGPGPFFPPHASRRYRLSIWHLLIGTTWVACIFGLANYFGGLEFAYAVVGWIVLQTILVGGIKLCRLLRNRAHLSRVKI